MLTREVTIDNKLGLHARAAAKLVKTAAGYACELHLNFNGRQVNAKSIMGLMMLAASRGSQITLTAVGEDAEAALNALEDLIVRRRFDED